MTLLGKRSAGDACEAELHMVEKTRRLNITGGQQPALQQQPHSDLYHPVRPGEDVAVRLDSHAPGFARVQSEPTTPNQEEEENRLLQELQKKAMEAPTLADYQQANSLLKSLHEERLRRLGGHQ